MIDINGLVGVACVNHLQKQISPPASVIFPPINAPGMGRFQLLNLGVLGYGSELKFWVVIAIIVCRERLFFRGRHKVRDDLQLSHFVG